MYNNDDYTDPDGNGGQQQDDSRTDESVIYKLPKFVTKPQNLMVNEGSTIRLPCVVDRLGKWTKMWINMQSFASSVTIYAECLENQNQFDTSEYFSFNSKFLNLVGKCVAVC